MVKKKNLDQETEVLEAQDQTEEQVSKKQALLNIVADAPAIPQLQGATIDPVHEMATKFLPKYNELLARLKAFSECL